MKNGSNMNQSTIIKIMATFMLTFSVSRANSITSENLNIMGLNKIDSQVTWGRAAESLNANFNHINSDMEKMKNASSRNKGYFLTEADMKAAYPTANVGDKAYVGTSESFAIWVYETNGWKNSGKTGGDESVDLEQYYTKTEVDEIVLTPAKDVAAYAEVAATQATNAATSASESAQSAADAANSAEASKAASKASAKSALAAEEKSKEAAISAFNAKNSASLAVSTAEQAVEIAKDATNTSNDSLETSISNRYGYNVTIHGLKGGIHTLASAIKDVPAKHRMLGQKITFRTENGDWATYHNESLSLDNYTNTDDWVQEVGISSVTGDINISNNPDYEDLTEANDGTIKFADKEYNKDSFSGLGRAFLRKNIVNDVNVLTQDMISKANTIYIIQYDYDLQGAEITIPEGCVLDFQGGSLSNGAIIGNNTGIKVELVKIFDLNIEISGTWNVAEVYPEWFGAKGNGYTDDYHSLQKTIKVSVAISKKVFVTSKYYTSQTLDIGGAKLTGIRMAKANLNYYISEKYGNVGYDFMRGTGNGAKITFNEMLDDVVSGSCIVSDTANPILYSYAKNNKNYSFELNNLGIIGWIRNLDQKGLFVDYDKEMTYVNGGGFNIKNFSAIGFGNNGIELPSLECTTIENVNCSNNNGYGFAVIGHSEDASIDTPFEYVDIKNCRFNYNRKDGFYSNVFRKQVAFDNCQVQMPGQYDYYDDIPSNAKDVVSGIKIDGVCPVHSGGRVGVNLSFNNIWGELCQIGIHVANTQENAGIVGLSITNCYTNRIQTKNPSAIFYVGVRYITDFNVNNCSGNYEKTGYINDLASGVNFIGSQLWSICDDKSPFKGRYYSLNVDDVISCKSIKTKSNFVLLEQNAGTESYINTDYVKKVFGYNYPSPQQAIVCATFLAGYFYPNADGDVFKATIIVVTRTSNGKYHLVNMSNEVDVTIDRTTAIVSIKVGSWCRAFIQRLDTINIS